MKRVISVLMMMILLFASIAFGEIDNVSVMIPSYDVTVNGLKLDTAHSQYPVITYNNITYIPMTSDYLSGFGLTSTFNGDDGLTIDMTDKINPLEQKFLNADNRLDSKHLATIVPFAVTVNGKLIDNKNAEYPVLLYKSITYFPMTWRFAVTEFGWETKWSNATGFSINIEKDRVFEVSKIEDLFEINNYSDRTFKLMNDLDFNSVSDYKDMEVYKKYKETAALPVNLILKSKLDGNHKSIRNLTIKKRNSDNIALFEEIDHGGSVYNLNLVNFNMSGNSSIGLLTLKNYGRIKNVKAEGIIVGERILGGIAAHNYYIIQNSQVDITISGDKTYDITKSRIGGIVGRNKGIVEEVVANGKISGAYSLGGLVGMNFNILRNAVSNVSVQSTDDDGDYFGGGVGVNAVGEIENVIAYGPVDGRSYTGGLVGSNQDGMLVNSVAANPYIAGTRTVAALVGENDYDAAKTNVKGTFNNYYYSKMPISADKMNMDADAMGTPVSEAEFLNGSLGSSFWDLSHGHAWNFNSIWTVQNGKVQLKE